MVEHYSHGMNFSRPQLLKLYKGQGVRVTNSHLTGPHRVLLTKRQMNKIAKSKRNGVGMVLRMSEAQLAQNKRGGGIFDVLKSGLKILAPHAIDYGANFLKKKVAGAGFFGDLIRGVGGMATNGLAKLAGGSVRRRAPKRAPKRGKGFLGDLVRTVGGVGVNSLAKLAGGKLRKRKAGGSFVLPGY